MRKTPEQPSSFEPGGHYNSEERQRGIARLAIHSAFEDAMAHADQGVWSREKALDHVKAVRPYILSHLGVVEVAE